MLLFYNPKAQTEIKKFIGTDGTVNAIVHKGDTTCIGGNFSKVGINTKGLARFTGNSTKPDVNFPELSENSFISVIEPDSLGCNYLGGYFEDYDGKVNSYQRRQGTCPVLKLTLAFV